MWLHNYIVKYCEYNDETIKIGMDIKKRILYDMCKELCVHINGCPVKRVRITIEGVFLKRKAVCQGIAMAYRCLCIKIGIESIVVRGNSLKPGDTNYERYAWNIIKVGESSIHVDITWDMCLTNKGCPSLKVALHR